MDPLQFAYRANRSVDYAVNMGLHFILQHLDRPGTHERILFVDFSSAFNTIIPDTLQNKLTQLSVPTSICQWITSFLTNRQQLVRLGKFSSSTRFDQHWSSSGLCSLPTIWFCFGGLSLLSQLSSMLGCMDVQGVLAQNGIIPLNQTVRYLSINRQND